MVMLGPPKDEALCKRTGYVPGQLAGSAVNAGKTGHHCFIYSLLMNIQHFN